MASTFEKIVICTNVQIMRTCKTYYVIFFSIQHFYQFYQSANCRRCVSYILLAVKCMQAKAKVICMSVFVSLLNLHDGNFKSKFTACSIFPKAYVFSVFSFRLTVLISFVFFSFLMPPTSMPVEHLPSAHAVPTL